MEGQGVEHRDVGPYRFSLFVIPEGDHWRWQVNRVKLDLQLTSQWGEPVPGGTGTAPWAADAREQANKFFMAFLKDHPNGE